MKHVWLFLSAVLIMSLTGCDQKRSAHKPGRGTKASAGKMGVFAPAEVVLGTVEGSELRVLNEPLVFTGRNGKKWTAPKGTLTDGASIPDAALPFIGDRFDSRYLNAAIVHDAYSQTDNELVTVEQYRRRTWESTHRMFFDACLAGGTPTVLAKTMYAGVLIGGPRWEADKREPSSGRNARPTKAQIKTMTDRCKEFINGSDPKPEEIEAWVEDQRHELMSAK